MKPSWVGLTKGPQTSQWTISKASEEMWLKDGKGNFFYLVIGHRTQSLLLWNWITSGIWLCRVLSLLSETFPSLRCQRNGLETTRTLETEFTSESKTDCKMEETPDIDLQSGETYSK